MLFLPHISSADSSICTNFPPSKVRNPIRSGPALPWGRPSLEPLIPPLSPPLSLAYSLSVSISLFLLLSALSVSISLLLLLSALSVYASLPLIPFSSLCLSPLDSLLLYFCTVFIFFFLSLPPSLSLFVCLPVFLFLPPFSLYLFLSPFFSSLFSPRPL